MSSEMMYTIPVLSELGVLSGLPSSALIGTKCYPYDSGLSLSPNGRHRLESHMGYFIITPS